MTTHIEPHATFTPVEKVSANGNEFTTAHAYRGYKMRIKTGGGEIEIDALDATGRVVLGTYGEYTDVRHLSEALDETRQEIDAYIKSTFGIGEEINGEELDAAKMAVSYRKMVNALEKAREILEHVADDNDEGEEGSLGRDAYTAMHEANFAMMIAGDAWGFLKA